MKANLIKTLKNNAELVDIEAGRSARANFPGVDFDNAVLIINGKICEPDTIIQDNDIVTIRQIPGNLTETPWWVATFIIPFGFLIQPAELAYKARKEAEAAERELEKLKKLSNSPEIDNRPFLRGATNTLATGKSQPYFCGRNFLTPYLFSKPYYKISGTDGVTQEVYNIIECGFKGIVFDKIGIGDTTIKTLGGSTPQNDVYTINSGLFANGQIEIRQNGDAFSTLTELNEKVNSTVINREVIPDYKVQRGDAEYKILTLDPNARNVEVCIQFPYGIYAYNDDGERVKTIIQITPEYSLNGGNTWVKFNFPCDPSPLLPIYPWENSWFRNTTKSLRFVGVKEFTLSDYTTLHNNGQSNILVRVRSNAEENEKARTDCYVYFYQSKIFDPLKSSAPAGILNDGGAAGLVPCLNVEARERGVSCIAGLKLVATENNQDKLSQINIIATSTARTWNGSAWSETKAPTRNPAAIALEIYTSDTHPASRYADTEIDFDAFGALYEYCVNNDIYFDDVITQAQKKDAELQKIADVCGCAFYKDIYGRISVAIDQAQENAVAVYNPQNIISLTNKKTFARRVDALRIKYIDSANDTYKENTYTVTRLENGQPVTIDENSIIKEINATGITRQPQIVKYARRLMAIDELRPVTTTLKIGAEGVYFTPYAKIGIQDPSINRDAQDAVIESVTYLYGTLRKIILRNPVTFTDPQKQYGVVVNTVKSNGNGAAPLALKVSGTGTTRELTVINTYSAAAPRQPAANNVVSFGELDDNGEFTKITHEYVITRIARGDGGFNLDLQEYNEAIYEPGTIPAYKPLVNNVPTPAAGVIPPDAVTHEELDTAIVAVDTDAVQAAVDTIQNGYRFTNIYTVRPVPETLEEIIARLDDDAKNQSASISMSEEEILIKVEDLDSQQRAYIDLTKDEILAEVDDMARELTGLIDVQAGAVTALVKGGGAAGELSLSLNLPVMIDATTRAQLITASTAEKVNAVYGLVEGTEYYGIKGNASNAAVKALWDDAVAGRLIASQIVLSADQINIAGKTIYTSGKTDSVASAAASTAEASAKTYADSVADTAAVNKRADVARALGYASWAAMETDARLGKTIIDGGYLRTALIDVNSIFTKNLTLTGGSAFLQSGNFSMGTEGFRITDSGITAFNRVIMSKDIEMPLQVNWIDELNVNIDMQNENADAIKVKLDEVLTNYGTPIFDTAGSDDKIAFVNTVSTDQNNFYVNHIPGLNYKEMQTHYLCRYTNGNGVIYYTIGNVETSGLFLTERELLKIENGVVTKKPSGNYGSDKLLINSASTKAEFYSGIYTRNYIKARYGYRLQHRGTNGSFTNNFTTDHEVYAFCDKLLQNVGYLNDSHEVVQCWASTGSYAFPVIIYRVTPTLIVVEGNQTRYNLVPTGSGEATIKYFLV